MRGSHFLGPGDLWQGRIAWSRVVLRVQIESKIVPLRIEVMHSILN
jgi:hypothetical protein